MLVSGCAATPTLPSAEGLGPATRATAAGSVAPGGSGLDAVRLTASRALVERRVAALAAGDREAWLSAVHGAALRAEQAAVFDRMRAMRVGALRVESVRVRGAGSGAQWEADAAFTYQLAGIDSAPRRFTLGLTMRAGPRGDRLPSIIESAPADRPQPWDLAGLRVHRSVSGLVLATGGADRVAEVAAHYATARAAVVAVWGTARPAVVIAPTTQAEAARLLGRDPVSLHGVAAVTDGPVTARTGAGADRVVILPDAWDALTEQGREVVLAHELTHVTMRSTATGPMPLWLSEGFAEYVAYRAVDLPERRIVAAALDRVRKVGVPTEWPAAAEFEPGNDRLPVAYGLSLLAVRSIADRHGQAALVRLCRAVAHPDVDARGAAGAEDTDARTGRAIREMLAADPATERLAWQQRIERLIAP
jgi:hypothetical protein